MGSAVRLVRRGTVSLLRRRSVSFQTTTKRTNRKSADRFPLSLALNSTPYPSHTHLAADHAHTPAAAVHPAGAHTLHIPVAAEAVRIDLAEVHSLHCPIC